MIVNYLDIYNKLQQQPTTSKNQRTKAKLSEWLAMEQYYRGLAQ